MFWDTLNLNTEELKRENARVLYQEDLIKAIYEANPTLPISPAQILSIFIKKYSLNVPITSIRRGITNLSTDSEKLGLVSCLIKTPVKVPGLYHLPEHCWIWKEGNEDKGIEKMPLGTTMAEYAEKIIAKSTNKLIQKEMFEWDFEDKNDIPDSVGGGSVK